MKLAVLGLSITSSWGNGHATTYRALLREFAKRGHEVVFLERDVPWYRDNRDLVQPDFCRTVLYRDLDQLKSEYASLIRDCDWAIVGSYVPQGVEVGHWVCETSPRTAFYDIDTPVTLAKLERGDYEYLSPELISRYALYLSFSGGPTLGMLERMGSPKARPLYCSVDTEMYYEEHVLAKWELTYLGTYSEDRQPKVNELVVEPAHRMEGCRFCVAGPQYPLELEWPENVARIDHLPPAEHREFYSASRWTLNITRADMVAAGWSPSVRLFEAAACGTPIISDFWCGLDEFLEPDKEIRLAATAADVTAIMQDTSDTDRRAIGEAARTRILKFHSAIQRAAELEAYLTE